MITASLGSRRFESGPTYHYNGSTTEQLLEDVFRPDQTTDYVNSLKGVDATPEEIQQIAAAGIVRLAVGEPDFMRSTEATRMLLTVCNGDVATLPTDIFKDPHSWEDRLNIRGSLTNAEFDSASVLATRKNREAETAGLIEAKTSTDEAVFIIGLGHGGFISAARTFLHLNGEENNLSFVRYSRYKHDDKLPNMYPYPEERKASLKRRGNGRKVVVYDEDYSSKNTLRTAVEFFAELFGEEVYGLAPVEVERRITYKPLLIKS